MEKETKNAAVKVANAEITTSDPRFGNLSPARQQEVISAELFGTAEKMDCNYSEYGKKCAINGIVAAQIYLKSVKKGFADVNLPLFVLSLHNLAVTELNCATIPAEAFCDMRGDVLTFKPQGIGNERLLRKFGVGIKPETGLHKCWIVREGDDFRLPQFDGLDVVPPKWTPKSLSGKVKMVVYPVEKANGDIEWLMSDRGSVIANVVAQIRQNALYAFVKKDANGYPMKDRYGRQIVDQKARDDFYAKINELADKANGDLDAFLENKEVQAMVNPTYTSFGSKEAMILRKMQNNALKQYPKDYETSIVAKAVSDMTEDRDPSLESRDFVDVDAEEERKAEKPADFDVYEATGEIIPKKQETPSNRKQEGEKGIAEANEEAKTKKEPSFPDDPTSDEYEDLR